MFVLIQMAKKLLLMVYTVKFDQIFVVNIAYLSLLMYYFIRLSCFPIKILYLVYWLKCSQTELLIMNNYFKLPHIFLIIDLLIKKNQIASSVNENQHS